MKAVQPMAKNLRAPPPAFLGSEFNAFLFASIGIDRNGLYLSVVSALARLDLDPWSEAAKLATLPVETAVQKLSSVIAALQDIPSARQESGKIAARLIALLPRGLGVTTAPANAAAGATPIAEARLGFVILLLVFTIMLAVQMLVHAVPPPAAGPATASAVTSQKLPPR
jgi:hypothetical protein